MEKRGSSFTRVQRHARVRMDGCRTESSAIRLRASCGTVCGRCGRWWARVRGTFTRTLAYLTSTVLPRRPRGDEGGGGMAWHGFFSA